MSINQIATLATKINKPNKADIFDIVRYIANSTTEDIDDITAHNLAKLYSFFIPTVSKPKTEEQWVAKAVGKNDVRKYLNYCYSDGTRYMATDGYRAHYINTDKPKGFYDTSGTPVDITPGKYPLIDRLIPKGESVNMSEYKIVDTGKKWYPQTAHIPFKNSDKEGTIIINYRYLKEALSLLTNTKMYIKDENSPLRLDFPHDRHAIIMGIYT